MNMHTTSLACVLSIAWGAAFAETAESVSPLIGFFEAGVLCAQDGGTVREAPDTVAGTTHVVEDAPPFVSNGRVVPAVLGIGFGVRAGLESPLTLDGVTMTVSHPQFKGATEQSFLTTLGTKDDPGITFYQFDEPYELALGDWTMTASYEGTVFYQATFTVVPPAALPELAGACGYLDLIG